MSENVSEKAVGSDYPISKKYGPSTKEGEFEIHDNGGRPYRVMVSPQEKKAYVYTYWNVIGKGDKTSCDDLTHLLREINYLRYWPGYDPQYPAYLGNSLLFEIGVHEYVHVTDSIYRFCTQEPIQYFVSPVGNSDVPYPYAFNDQHVYFIGDTGKDNFISMDFEQMGTYARQGDIAGYVYGHQCWDPEHHQEHLDSIPRPMRGSRYPIREICRTYRSTPIQGYHEMNERRFYTKIYS